MFIDAMLKDNEALISIQGKAPAGTTVHIMDNGFEIPFVPELKVARLKNPRQMGKAYLESVIMCVSLKQFELENTVHLLAHLRGKKDLAMANNDSEVLELMAGMEPKSNGLFEIADNRFVLSELGTNAIVGDMASESQTLYGAEDIKKLQARIEFHVKFKQQIAGISEFQGHEWSDGGGGAETVLQDGRRSGVAEARRGKEEARAQEEGAGAGSDTGEAAGGDENILDGRDVQWSGAGADR